MTTDLHTVARIAQEASRHEVCASMEAHQRFYPAWETYEVPVHYAIRNGLSALFGAMPQPIQRVAVEYDDIKNVDFPPHHKSHAVDVVVLHPLVGITEPKTSPGYAWAEANKAVLGLIEVKTDWTSPRVLDDAIWLDEVSRMSPKPDMRELEWVILVVFFAGRTGEAVNKLGEDLGKRVAEQGLRTLTSSSPSVAPTHPGSAGVVERWFEFMCYGKMCPRSE